MKYSKPIMSIAEMHKELGIPTQDLRRYVHIPGQKFARKTSGGGKWLFDTEEFEKVRMSL